jgi:hypothetical protein
MLYVCVYVCPNLEVHEPIHETYYDILCKKVTQNSYLINRYNLNRDSLVIIVIMTQKSEFHSGHQRFFPRGKTRYSELMTTKRTKF